MSKDNSSDFLDMSFSAIMHDNTIQEQISHYAYIIQYKEKEENNKVEIKAYVTHLICAINKLEELFNTDEEEIIKFRDYLLGIGIYNKNATFPQKESLIISFKTFCYNNFFTLFNTFMALLKPITTKKDKNYF